VIASAVMAKTGPWGLYHFTASCGGVLGVAAYIYRKKLAGEVEDKVPFILRVYAVFSSNLSIH